MKSHSKLFLELVRISRDQSVDLAARKGLPTVVTIIDIGQMHLKNPYVELVKA